MRALKGMATVAFRDGAPSVNETCSIMAVVSNATTGSASGMPAPTRAEATTTPPITEHQPEREES